MTYKIRLSGCDDQGRRVYNVIDEQGNVIYSANYYYTQKFLEFMTGGSDHDKEENNRPEKV